MFLDYWDDPSDAGRQQDGSGSVCSLTVNLRARPLSPGVFVGGADGVSHCRQRLQQSRQTFSDKEAAPDKTRGPSVLS